jgi:hypothetical protein
MIGVEYPQVAMKKQSQRVNGKEGRVYDKIMGGKH